MKIIFNIWGNLHVKLIGNTPERFLNICNANDIDIRQVEYKEGYYYFWITPRDYKKLLPIVFKTNMRPVIIEKKGVPFLIFRYRKHQCFLIGIMLSFFIIYILSLYVWEIDFEGNSIYSDEIMMNCLKENNIVPGVKIKGIDCVDIEKMFRKKFKEITWVSAEISGTRLLIFIKENDEDPIEVQSEDSCDLIATKDGIVDSIITRTGTPMVKAGDKVKTGDILVSGEIITYDDADAPINRKWVHADADILLKTSYEYENELKIAYQYKIYTGKCKKIYYIDINGNRKNLGIKPDFDTFQVYNNAKKIKLTKNFFLPLEYGTMEYVEYYIDTDFYTESEAKSILERRFLTFLENLARKGVQIIEKNVKIEKNAVSYFYSGEISVLEAAFIESKPVDLTEGIGENEYR